MSTKIIVSYDGTANEEDAITLGRLLGGAGAEISLAYVRHNPETDSVREEIAQAVTSSPTARRRRAWPRWPSARVPR
jgi:hypothetical protein